MKTVTWLLFAMLSTPVAFGADAPSPAPIVQARPISPINADHGIAVRGYDPVAYFADGQPRPGSAEFEWTWQGARWRFASDAHRRAFQADPARYAPQYGGYCALAISLGRVADGDPAQWAIVDGKLFLNNNARAKAAWDEDRAGNIAKANQNWPRFRKSGPPPADAGAGR
jgi:YHS domain-containing protein